VFAVCGVVTASALSPVARFLAKAAVGLGCADWVVAKDGSDLPDTALLIVYAARAMLMMLLLAAIPKPCSSKP
jgi:hypothetical protein